MKCEHCKYSYGENEKLKEVLRGILERLNHDDFSSNEFMELKNKAEKLCKE